MTLSLLPILQNEATDARGGNSDDSVVHLFEPQSLRLRITLASGRTLTLKACYAQRLIESGMTNSQL
ncbi:hypothetical protein [Nostoc sp.]|uniref:hypothetical protein n=1 Tax=Nostoc sp. TaxID=1180 RepID=UPI002FF7F8F9